MLRAFTVTKTKNAEWQAGYDIGLRGQAYLRPGPDISNEFADSYAHGRADFEGHRAKIKTEREMGGSIRKLLRALKLRG
jgi:hypothetical protein